MAYIDFYRKGIRYRANIGLATMTGALNMSVYRNIVSFIPPNNEGEGQTIKSGGTELFTLFNVDNLDFTNPPDTIGQDKGYSFQNADATLFLNIKKKNNISYNVEGSISHYVYTGARYIMELALGNVGNYISICSNTAIRPNRNISHSYAEPPTSVKRGAFENRTELCIIGCKVVYNGKEYTAMTITDENVYKGNKIVFGQQDALEGDYTRCYGFGLTYDKIGKRYYILSRPTIMVTDISKWTYGTTSLDRQLIGSGSTVTEDFRVFAANDTYAFSLNDTQQPDNEDFPKYPDEGTDEDPDEDPDKPTGGDGDHDKSSDEIPDDVVQPAYDTSGLLTIYELQNSNLQELGKKLWSENVFTKFLKITGNPIDSIIQLLVSYVAFDADTSSNIYLGNVELDIIAPIIKSPIKDVDLGSINITEFWGDFKDYNPFTKIQIYLPYVGIIDLNVNEVMGSKVALKYRFNLMSNTCVALITINKEINGTKLNSVLYQFDGSFCDEIPVSAASNNTKISARLSQLGAINNAVRQIGNTNSTLNQITSGLGAGINILQNEISANHLDVARSGNMKGSAGILSIAEPYIIIERPMPSYPSNYASLKGVPLNRKNVLSSMKGFTVVAEIDLDNVNCTSAEKQQLEQLLKEGVFI